MAVALDFFLDCRAELVKLQGVFREKSRSIGGSAKGFRFKPCYDVND